MIFKSRISATSTPTSRGDRDDSNVSASTYTSPLWELRLTRMSTNQRADSAGRLSIDVLAKVEEMHEHNRDCIVHMHRWGNASSSSAGS